MKKLSILALVFLSMTTAAFALPVGNPAEASLFCEKRCCVCCSDEFSVRVGFYGDYVFNRNWKTSSDRKVDYSQITTNAGYFALNYCNIAEVFTTLGATKLSFNTSLGPFNSGNTGPRFDFESSSAFSWSVGGRATLYEYKCASLGIVGQYFSSRTIPKVLFVRTNVDDYPNPNHRIGYHEAQLGVGISYCYNPYFVPYAAVKFSRAFWKFNNETFSVTGTTATIPNFKTDKTWGYAIGTTFIPCKCDAIAITVEGRFADEAAFHVNAQVRF